MLRAPCVGLNLSTCGLPAVSSSVPQYDLAVSSPLISETHRLVTSTPDPLEVMSAKHRGRWLQSSNDIFGRIGGYFWFHRATREEGMAIARYWI